MHKDYESDRESILTVLSPVFELLIHKRQVLEAGVWQEFVSKTEASIIAHPDQYLAKNLFAPQFSQLIVRELFLEYFSYEEVSHLA